MTKTTATAAQIKGLTNLHAAGGKITADLVTFRAHKINGNSVWGMERKGFVTRVVENDRPYLVITPAGLAAIGK